MENSLKKNDQLVLILKIVMVFVVSAALFLIVYKYDNKYTAQSPKAMNGVLILNNKELVSMPVVFLIDGWEYYHGKLLAPTDFDNNAPVPDQYIFIGQFGGFEKWNNGNPHGSASYRLNIQIPDEPSTYLLELPEIFSAYKLYINGKQVMQMGNPIKEHYQPKTANKSISIEAGGIIEILFAVSDYSHLYSGIVYPPAFGNPDAVSNILSSRIVFRSFLCSVALTIGLLSIMIGLMSHKNSLTLLFGFLCLFFVGYISYPITQTFFSGFRILYTLENLSFCVMLAIIILISINISKLPKRFSIPFLVLCGIMCASSVILHLLLPIGNLKIMMSYSWMISAYEWISAGFILFTIFYAIKKGIEHLTPILYGIVILICALIADRLLPVHEPIFTGWFIELASFALVLCIGLVIGYEVTRQYRENAVITERANSMERLYKSQLTYLETLKQRIDETKIMRHDIRHHLTVMDKYLHNKRYDKLEEYIKQYHIISTENDLAEYCPIDIINTLTHHYHTLAQQNNIHLDIRCNLKGMTDPSYTKMTDLDLCSLYANLLENAMESCKRAKISYKFIRIAIFRTAKSGLHIYIWNSAENIRQSGKTFLSSKKENQTGYGLTSVENIAKKYDGKAKFHWYKDRNEFETKVTVMA